MGLSLRLESWKEISRSLKTAEACAVQFRMYGRRLIMALPRTLAAMEEWGLADVA